jgi:predicted tellurium resistance membrane protein TerC
MFEALMQPENIFALLTLTILEIVLGVDNIVFIAIVTNALPEEKRPLAQRLGLGLALFGRVALVFGVSALVRLESTAFRIASIDFTWSGLILIAGGLFLLYKATVEIFNTTELREEEHAEVKRRASFVAVVFQILIIDMIFAIDSVLTAIGLTSHIELIIIAITIAIAVMMFYATPLARFIHAHPSVKVLALAFLVVIGVLLLMEGFHVDVDRNYVYFAIIFSLAVEGLNFRRQTNLQKRLAAEVAGTGTV